MKKLLLSLSFLGLLGTASAQMNVVITDAGGANVTGTTLNYWVPCTSLDTRLWNVTDAGGNSVTIKVKKTVLALNDAGATVYFCTDVNCYSPAQTLSYAVTLNGSGGTDQLTTDFNPNSVAGITTVRYTVINQANMNDTAWFVITYNVSCSPAGIISHLNEKPSVSNPAPNPASSVFAINYKLGNATIQGAKMVVYNMLGDRVMETSVEETEGTIKMDISTLDQGVYFCALESDGKTLATRRLVVAH